MKPYCTALMYHVLYANEEEWHALLDEEKPYAVSTKTFEMHLQLLQQLGCQILDPLLLKQNAPWQPGVVITFDDGHRSHYTHALPLLEKYQAKAVFFITTDFVEKDPRFCSWEELQALHKQGMSVQAHGHTHGFFANMDNEQALAELKTSYELLSANIESPWSMSFPGGRYTARDYASAQAQGFSHVFTSDIDAINQTMFQGKAAIPRFAIKNATTAAGFREMAQPTPLHLLRSKTISNAKKTIKKLLGNHFYHWLYTLKAGRGNKE